MEILHVSARSERNVAGKKSSRRNSKYDTICPKKSSWVWIEAWLDMQEQEPEYVIIDDLSQEEFNEDQIPHLAIAHPQNGLDQITANRAIEILNGKN